MRAFKDYLLLFLKGLGMGTADVIPGVSGGTIAFITGIYGVLLGSINAWDGLAWKLLLTFRFKDFWQKINGAFLLPLGLGILVSLLSFARLFSFLLKQHPIPLWSFFIGLIIVSALSVAKDIQKWRPLTLLCLALGMAMAYYITVMTPAQTPEGLGFVFLSGMIAICAMILPGLSGSFVLLLMGKYQFILTALNHFDLPVLLTFALGAVIGLLSFSRLIAWLLRQFHDCTVALLVGCMLGAINKIWPWKLPPLYDKNLLPAAYEQATGQAPMLLQAACFAALGMSLVVVVQKIVHQNRPLT